MSFLPERSGQTKQRGFFAPTEQYDGNIKPLRSISEFTDDYPNKYTLEDPTGKGGDIYGECEKDPDGTETCILYTKDFEPTKYTMHPGTNFTEVRDDIWNFIIENPAVRTLVGLEDMLSRRGLAARAKDLLKEIKKREARRGNYPPAKETIEQLIEHARPAVEYDREWLRHSLGLRSTEPNMPLNYKESRKAAEKLMKLGGKAHSPIHKAAKVYTYKEAVDLMGNSMAKVANNYDKKQLDLLTRIFADSFFKSWRGIKLFCIGLLSKLAIGLDILASPSETDLDPHEKELITAAINSDNSGVMLNSGNTVDEEWDEYWNEFKKPFFTDEKDKDIYWGPFWDDNDNRRQQEDNPLHAFVSKHLILKKDPSPLYELLDACENDNFDKYIKKEYGIDYGTAMLMVLALSPLVAIPVVATIITLNWLSRLFKPEQDIEKTGNKELDESSGTIELSSNDETSDSTDESSEIIDSTSSEDYSSTSSILGK